MVVAFFVSLSDKLADEIDIVLFSFFYCVFCLSSWRRPLFIQWNWFIQCHAFVWFVAYRIFIFGFIWLWFVCFCITNHFFDRLLCCRDLCIIGIHYPLALSFLISLIQNQCNIFISFAHNSLLSSMKASSSKTFVLHNLKIYQLFRFWPPWEIQVKITTFILKGVLHKLKNYQFFHSWTP